MKKQQATNIFNTTESALREVSFISPMHSVSVKSSFASDSLDIIKAHALDVLKRVKGVK